MFDVNIPSKAFLNRAEYEDKVLGCWTGKNIGGTLGAPFEGKQAILDVKFYTQDLKGNPIPNDDLDLQLVWLRAIEDHGIYNINERLLGEYWLAHVVGPWEEYGICRNNMVNGLYPPLSGLCNNARWHNGNGAWIRSEIWACLFPGAPDDVAEFAWYDACVDHAGDGIYAEIFTATLESMAFIESDLHKLIEIALSKIPSTCRVTRSVRLALAEYKAGHDFITARNAVLKDSEDLSWFHAPANIAFTVIGLLYGEGDFARSICIAVNCGDDTDCTGATAGAVMGIIKGRSGIPREWIEPIGENIKTVAVNPYRLELPETLGELTARTILCKEETEASNPTLPQLTDGSTLIPSEYREQLGTAKYVEKRVWSRSSKMFTQDVPWGKIGIEYEKGPAMAPGETQKIIVHGYGCLFECRSIYLDWQLPEGWSMKPGPQQSLMTKNSIKYALDVEITAGPGKESFTYIPVKVRISDRNSPVYLTVPFQLAGSVKSGEYDVVEQSYYDALNRRLTRRAKHDTRTKKQKTRKG
jgi:ADP-ribosylglycohydrolase